MGTLARAGALLAIDEPAGDVGLDPVDNQGRRVAGGGHQLVQDLDALSPRPPQSLPSVLSAAGGR